MRIKRGITPRVPEIGKIKIGEKSTQGRQGSNGTWYPPVKLECFNVVRPDRDKQKINYLRDDQVMDTLGDNPTEIPVILPFDDPEMVFQTSYAMYKGRACMCRGDGETAEMLFLKDGKPKAYTLIDTEDKGDTTTANERRKIVCDPDLCPNRQPNSRGVIACKPTGRLCCIIPASNRLNGYYFLRTTAYGTISGITKSLDDMKEQTGGILRGLPAKLFFSKRATEKHGNVPMVSIDWDFDSTRELQAKAIEEKNHRLQIGIDMKQIEMQAKQSGVLIDTDAPEDVIAEFYTDRSDEVKKAKAETESKITSRADAILGDVEDVVPEAVEQVEEKPEPEQEPEDKGEEEEIGSLF